ncbi:hypothetical protein OG874_22315 [Nocardia sp. NBC_00565]|uniref:hypothetical protein n=1 Tax=Nocardia sp. NBC_00565 TaxID=2975993 RepID=UPI002E8094BB|nr:hypothetical protein [Nocardia sp. NBC_00565]WUC07653.1 hypothetical protein OG874_22315 [Nocardia sp. NBC_00565]
MMHEPDSIAAQVRSLRARAERAGYRLVRDKYPPYCWTLLDAEDDDCIYSGSLDQINAWLKS